jgi:AcrR family transcriptional regulator
MSKSTLYKYFASKEDVIVVLVDEACSGTEAALDEVDLDEMSPDVALNAIVGIYAKHADRLPRAAVLQYRRLPAACQDRIELTRVRVGGELQGVMERGVELGAFAFEDPTLASTAFMASAEASMRAAGRGEVDSSRGEAVHKLLGLFRPGLVAGA